MAIVSLAASSQVARLKCAICKSGLLPEQATAGLYDSNNRQAFACASHFNEARVLILGWSDFLWNEYRKYRKPPRQPNELIYEEMRYAWPHS